MSAVNILSDAQRLARKSKTWADLSNALFDPRSGLVAKRFPDAAQRAAFRKSDTCAKLHGLVEQKMRQSGVVAGATPQKSGRFVVRLPRSLHAALEEEAAAEGTSLNQLVVTKLALRLSIPSFRARPKNPLAGLLKQAAPDARAEGIQNFKKGSWATGTVTRIYEYGAFVELAPGVEGFLHFSELEETDVLQEGQEVEVRVLNVDVQKRRIALSIRALEPSLPSSQHEVLIRRARETCAHGQERVTGHQLVKRGTEESKMARRKTYHVTPNKQGGWDVKGQGASRASSTHDTKADAVDRGRELAKGQPLGQLVIHKQDGTIQTEHTYGQDPYPPKG